MRERPVESTKATPAPPSGSTLMRSRSCPASSCSMNWELPSVLVPSVARARPSVSRTTNRRDSVTSGTNPGIPCRAATTTNAAARPSSAPTTPRT